MIEIILSFILYPLGIFLVSAVTVIGVVIMWARSFSKHITEQTKDRQDS